MSFDFAFDLRSIVTFASDGSVALDGFVLPAIDAFLQEVEMADRAARRNGGYFRAEVVLFDFRVADGEFVDVPHRCIKLLRDCTQTIVSTEWVFVSRRNGIDKWRPT